MGCVPVIVPCQVTWSNEPVIWTASTRSTTTVLLLPTIATRGQSPVSVMWFVEPVMPTGRPAQSSVTWAPDWLIASCPRPAGGAGAWVAGGGAAGGAAAGGAVAASVAGGAAATPAGSAGPVERPWSTTPEPPHAAATSVTAMIVHLALRTNMAPHYARVGRAGPRAYHANGWTFPASRRVAPRRGPTRWRRSITCTRRPGAPASRSASWRPRWASRAR